MKHSHHQDYKSQLKIYKNTTVDVSSTAYNVQVTDLKNTKIPFDYNSIPLADKLKSHDLLNSDWCNLTWSLVSVMQMRIRVCVWIRVRERLAREKEQGKGLE